MKAKKKCTCPHCGYAVTAHRRGSFWECGLCNDSHPVRLVVTAREKQRRAAAERFKQRRAAEQFKGAK